MCKKKKICHCYLSAEPFSLLTDRCELNRSDGQCLSVSGRLTHRLTQAALGDELDLDQDNSDCFQMLNNTLTMVACFIIYRTKVDMHKDTFIMMVAMAVVAVGLKRKGHTLHIMIYPSLTVDTQRVLYGGWRCVRWELWILFFFQLDIVQTLNKILMFNYTKVIFGQMNLPIELYGNGNISIFCLF